MRMVKEYETLSGWHIFHSRAMRISFPRRSASCVQGGEKIIWTVFSIENVIDIYQKWR